MTNSTRFMMLLWAAVFILLILLMTGCTTDTSVVDIVWPTPVPPAAELYLEKDVPSVKGWTTLAIVKGARAEMNLKHKLDMAVYGIAIESTNLTIKASETAQDNIVGLLAALGMGGSAFLPVALKRKPAGCVSKEDHEKEVIKAGKMAPSEFKKTLSA